MSQDVIEIEVQETDGSTTSVPGDSDDGRRVLRHSTAHVLAQAVCRLWPGTKLAGGTTGDDDFSYDFQLPDGARLKEGDLSRIEECMREIVASGQNVAGEELPAEDARELFSEQPFRRELVEEAMSADGDATVGVYRVGEGFAELCRGPLASSTDAVGAFRLLRVAGAYWRGDEDGAQLQRIYGTAWESEEALDAYLDRLKEAETRDHRRLGADLDLFSTPDELGGGLVLWHPKGAAVRRVIEDFSRDEHEAAGYQLVFTPHLARSALWETSGHLDFYADGMYPPMELDGSTYYPRPMNCPFHVLIYRSHPRTYRELPLRIFELGTVYRYERAGVLHGLLRARGFTQDDSHIFCTREQLADELASLLAFVVRILSSFGFSEFHAALATRPDGKSVGGDDDWDQATDALRQALDATDLPYEVDEGGGAFYGPKVDVHVSDALGRRWQLSTIQVDFQLPSRFEITYTGSDDRRHPPIMVHRALFGSVERFFGILVEHHAGAFPTWLAPVQARILPVRDEHREYATEVAERLRAERLRVEVGDAHEPLGARVRKGKLEKVPYLLVVGDEDAAEGTVAVNALADDGPDRGVPIDAFLDRARDEVKSKKTP